MPGANTELIDSLAKMFENSIVEAISTISGVAVLKNNDLSNDPNDNYAGMLPFSGEINGFFMIKTDGQSLKILTSYITGCDIPLVKENDMMDCIGELTNMVCGSVKAKAAINGVKFTLSVPFSVKGNNGLEFSFKKNAKTFALHFSSHDAHINARVLLT